MQTLSGLAADLRARRTSSEELVEACLARIDDQEGEGARAFTEVRASAALETARAIDALRSVGAEPSPYAGVPVSVKDLFDIRDQVTHAGSRVLSGPPAARDATSVARLRRAGLIMIGRTNMSEFAFSGLGINPHYGTPANPWDRVHRRIPGGSSSGAAVSLTDGMAHGALATDTGGSCRIPAALCGLVGFKPTQASVPRDGIVPLSGTLDTVGVLGRSVSCCATLWAMLSGVEPTLVQQTLEPLQRPPCLAVPANYLLDELDANVTAAFRRAMSRLGDAGAQLIELQLPELDGLPEMNAGGGFPAGESFVWHRALIAGQRADYDPRILSRILRGERQSAADLIELHARRSAMIAGVQRRLRGFDAFVCPTVPIVAPTIGALDDEQEYARVNLLLLRNPTVVNLLDGCAVSLPMHEPKDPPAGLMVAGVAGTDADVLRTAAWIEELG